MSYALDDKANKRMAYTKISGGDDESQSQNPLTTGAGKKQKQKIETQLQSIQQKIKMLEDYHRQIGTDLDNQKFRQKIQQALVQTGTVIKSSANEIKDFGDMEVPQEYVKQKRDQFTAFQEKQKQMVQKVQMIGAKIKEKQIQYADQAIQARQSFQASMTSATGENNAGDFMVNGVAEEENPLGGDKLQLKLTDQDLVVKNESDLMEAQINQRKADIDDIANIMSNINSIAQDIAIETKNQGEKLLKLDENMAVAEKNAEEALDELQQAQVHNRKTGKCTYFLVGVILICIIILGIILGNL